MTTFNTSNKLGSAAAKDLFDNAENLDFFVNDTENTSHPDRLGVNRKTWYGLQQMFIHAMAKMGWAPLPNVSFESGTTLTESTQALKYEADGNYYRWDGLFNKVVPEGSTPDSTGGIAKGAWINVTDLTLRTALASSYEGGGAALVNTPYNGNVQQLIGLSPFKRIGDIGSGVSIENAADAVKYNGMYYIYEGTLPHISTEISPDDNYRCVGLLNGWPVNHTMNWGIDGGTADHTAALQLMIKSASPNTTLISDGRDINIAGLNLTVDYPAVKLKGFRFAPFFVAGEVTIPVIGTITRSGIVLEDITVVKPPSGSTVTSGFIVNDALNLRVNRVVLTGTSGVIGTIFKCTNMKESGFSGLRCDLDPTNMTGVWIESNYCVNNTLSDSFVGFGTNLIHCTTATHPTYSYASEGWLVSNVIAVYFDNPLYMQRVTALHVVNCIFDFCGTRFYEFTLGGHNLISNCWFANRSTSSTTTAPCTVAGSTHTGLTLSSCDFINSNGTNTTPLLSHNGNSAYGTKVINCRAQGFSEGIVLHAASVMMGNTFQDAGASTYNIAAKSVVKGAGMSLENKLAWVAGSTFFDLAFSNGLQSSGIRGITSSQVDRAGMDFYTTLAATKNVVFSLIDDNIVTPRLPTTTAATVANGLYAGSDGIVRINR